MCRPLSCVPQLLRPSPDARGIAGNRSPWLEFLISASTARALWPPCQATLCDWLKELNYLTAFLACLCLQSYYAAAVHVPLLCRGRLSAHSS